jgi:RNA polymerase sigma-70 factor (ECF subfamily)
MTVKEYNEAVDNFSDGVFRFILKNIHDVERAKDIVQDTYEKMWVKHKDVDGKKAKSYLFSTAYHTMIDIIRKESRQVLFEGPPRDEPSFTGQYSDLNEILHRALMQLPESQRSVIMLRDYEGYSYQEISEMTDLSESQVKVYIYRGRLFLKKFIGSPDKVL